MASVLSAGPRGLLLPGHVSNSPPSLFQSPRGLVGYWGLDADCIDFTNNKAFDLSGNQVPGTIGAGVTWGAGQVGQALAFNTAANAPGINNFSWSNSFTNISVCAWVKPSDTTSRYDFVAKWFTSSLDYKYVLLQGATAGVFTFYISIDGGSANPSPNSFAYAAGVWYHLVGTYDGATIRLYVNGAEQGTGTAQAGSLYTLASESDTIGGSGDAGCVASIDDVRIYNRALVPWEITTLYQAGLQGRREIRSSISRYRELDAFMLAAADVLFAQVWM